MPTYTFELHDRAGGSRDEAGVLLRDRDRAFHYACDVVRELMRGRELETRSWRLDVHESGQGQVFGLAFADHDPTLDHLTPHLRTMVERICAKRGAFADALHMAKATVRESRALVARSRGKPYVATVLGKPVIR